MEMAQDMSQQYIRQAVLQHLDKNTDLQRCGLTDNHLKALMAREAASLGRGGAAKGYTQQPVEIHRQMALQVAQVAPTSFGPFLERWFHMVQLLDLSGSPAAIPGSSQALARIVGAWVVSARFCSTQKPEDVTWQVLTELSENISSLNAEADAKVTAADIAAEELRLAVDLDCSVDSPTIYVWVRIFAARIGLGISSALWPLLVSCSDLQDEIALTLAWNQQVSQENTPRDMAAGCFALALAAVHPGVAARLQPASSETMQWNMMLQHFFDIVLSAVPDGKQKLQKATPTAVGNKIIFAALEFATNMDLHHIQQVVCRIMCLIFGCTAAVRGEFSSIPTPTPVFSPVACPVMNQQIFQVVAVMPVFFSS